MAEYIEREALLLKLREKAHEWRGTFTADGFTESAKIVENFNAANVAPVIHGRWDDSADGITPYCSICGRSHRSMVRTPNYCHHCGAKMEV